MRQISLVAILFVGICCYVNAQTVQNVLDDARCSTAVINKLCKPNNNHNNRNQFKIQSNL